MITQWCTLPDHKRTPTVPWASTLVSVAVSGTDLVICGQAGSRLVSTLGPGQDGDRHCLECAGVGGPLMDPESAPPGHCPQGAWLQI